jgi:DNA-binding HxlR family transcriptional regulator
MLAQQLRQLEKDGVVQRKVHPEIPPKVEYRLTEDGLALRPALRALGSWAATRSDGCAPARPDHARAIDQQAG